MKGNKALWKAIRESFKVIEDASKQFEYYQINGEHFQQIVTDAANAIIDYRASLSNRKK